MGFHEVRFPIGISYGSENAPQFNTGIIELGSGAEERVARWSGSRRVYDAAERIKTWEQLAEIYQFLILRDGPANGFRFKDFLDCTSTPTGLATQLGGAAPTSGDQRIGIGDGTTTIFQLKKTYSDAIVTRTRIIRKPVEGTVLIEVNGVPQTEGINYTVDHTTGQVTLTVPAPNLHEVRAGFEFDVPVRFANEADESVRIAISNFGHGDIPNSVPIIEIFDPDQEVEEFFYGGAITRSFSADILIAILDGRLQHLNPSTNGLTAALPDPADLQPGAPWLYLKNVGSNSILILKKDGSTALTTLEAGSTVVLGIGFDSDDTTKIWVTV